MDIAEKTKRAKAIAEATGVSFSRAYKAVDDHPDPAPGGSQNLTSKPEPTVTDHRKTNFWAMVEADNEKRGGKVYDSILRVRKEHPAAFDEYLQIANK